MIMESMKAQNGTEWRRHVAIQVPPPLRSPPASSPPLAPSPVHLGACHRTSHAYHVTGNLEDLEVGGRGKHQRSINLQILRLAEGIEQPSFATRFQGFQGSRILFRFRSCLSTASAQPFSSEPQARYAKFEDSNRDQSKSSVSFLCVGL